MEFRVCSACSKFQLTGTACIGCRAPLTLADEGRFLGQTLGKYRVERVIGAGGMGVVFQATHLTLSRPAALKMILPHDHDPSFRERFIREARVLAGLKHPNIVEIYDFDVSPWGLPYFVMEYLEGCSLRDLTRTCPGPLPVELVGPIVTEVAAGLSFAHRRGIVHRDLKPHNVLVTLFDGRPVTKLLDFGLAKVLASEREATELTVTGAVVGTPAYLTPEHLNGLAAPHMDQYALALVVAELLVGETVRAGRTVPQILGEDLRTAIPEAFFPAGFDAGRSAALRRATSPEPADRFPDLDAFVEALALPPPTPAGAALLAGHVLRSTAPPTAPAPLSAPTSSTSAGFESTAIAPSSQERANVAAPPSTVKPEPATSLAPRIAWGLAAAGLVAFAAVLAVRRAPTPSSATRLAPPAVSPSSASPGAAREAGPPPLRELVRTIDVPPDADRLLGVREDLVVLAGGRHVYAVAADGRGIPATIPIEPCTEVLGATPDGLVWCDEGTRVTLVDPNPSPKTLGARISAIALPKLERPPGLAPRVYVSPTGAHLAIVQRASVDVYSVERGHGPIRRFGVPVDAELAVSVALSDRVAVVVEATKSLRAFEVERGALLASRPISEVRPDVVALSPMDDRVAVGGWFDEVYVFALGPLAHDEILRRHGRTYGLAWIADAPTLAIAGASGVALWRSGEGELAATPADQAARVDQIRFAGAGLLSLRTDTHRLEVDAYRGMPLPPRVKLADKEIWALAAGEDGSAYAGSSAGILYAMSPDGGVETAKLHTDGITSLRRSGDLLASASDDKTIAVWRLPELRVEWRSRAHDFLVNQIVVAGTPPSLYSSSSDGTVKRWKWPELEEQESIVTRDLFGIRYATQALWVAPAGDPILAGTWHNALLALRRKPGSQGKWTGRALDVPSLALYQLAELRAVRAVIFVGIQPCGVYLYDLDDGSLAEIEHLGADLYAVAALDDGRSASVLGNGAVLRYELERTADGRLAYAIVAGFDTELAAVTAASVLPGRGVIAAGTQEGGVYLLDAKLPAGAAVFRGVVRHAAKGE